MLFGKYINKFYLKYFVFFLLGILALVMVDFFQLEIPEIAGLIIDGIQDSSINAKLIGEYMIRLVFIAIIMFVGRFTWRYAIFGVGVKIEADLRRDMFSHSLKLENQYYKEHKTGGLLALFTNDLTAIRNAFADGTLCIIDALFLGIFSFVKMMMANWILSLLSLIPLIIIMVVSLLIGKVMERKYKERQEAYDKLSDFTQENFTGISVIKAFIKEYLEIKHFKKVNKNNLDKNIEFVRFSTLLDVLLTAFLSLVFAILMGGGAYFVLNGINGKTFTSGDLFAFISYFDSIIWPFLAISRFIQLRSQGNASYKRVEEFLDTNPTVVDNQAVLKEDFKGKVTFNHLSFRYPDSNTNMLNDISINIESGSMVGIVGKTGSGKTTLVDLLLRTFNLNKGELLIDDKDIMDLSIKQVRDLIGYVPQDNFLYSDSIENNIAFAFDELPSDEKIKNASKLASVDTNIEEFPDKYKTILGERGVTLSGGQKQRISIARALIKDPKILIFDDSVSAVDTKTEAEILTNLKNTRKNKTTIIIAHRISTVENLDNIVVLDAGRVVAQGTHQKLLKECSLYQEMVHLQELEKKVENEGDQNE